MKAKALVFSTDYSAEFTEKNIENGLIATDDKEFVADLTRPVLIKKKNFLSRWFGEAVFPLYFMKWNSLIPAHLNVEEKEGTLSELKDKVRNEGLKKRIENLMSKDPKLADKKFFFRELVPLEINFPSAFKMTVKDAQGKEKKVVITPEMLRSVSDMKFLKGFKQYAGGSSGMNKKKIMDILFIGGVIMFIFISMAIGGVIG